MELLESIPFSALGIITLLTLIYWYFTQNFNYWKKRGVPYATPYPIFGSMGGFLFKTLHTEDLKRYRKYGRVHGGFNGSDPYLTVGDPEILKQVLVKDFSVFHDRRDMECGDPMIDNMVVTLKGEDWKRVRNILTPIFTSGKLKKIYYIIEDSTSTLCSHFKEAAKIGAPIDLTRFYGSFTMDVILSTAFGTKIDSFHEENNKLVKLAKQVFRQQWRFFVFFVFPTLMKLFHIPAFSLEATSYLKEVILHVIKERKESGKRREDFLQMVLDASQELEGQEDIKVNNTNGSPHRTTGESNKKFQSHKSLSVKEIESQCVLFLAAAYETTAVTLSFVAYSLALNLKCQEKLIQEIDAAYEKMGKKTLDYDVVQNLEYLDCVVSETLRLYPPAIRPDRVANQDYKLGPRKIPIDKDVAVYIPIYAMHHDPEFYPDPEKFLPERFAPENKANIIPYTYLPFGIGPRNCIGMRFALMEIKICLVNVLRQFRFKKCSETKVPGEFVPGNVLIAPKSIMLKVEVRDDVPAA